jgi:predicted HicB family RNase H-like nuclease
MNMMTYKSYNARIEFDQDDEIFIGHIAGINDIIGFHADTVADLKSAFHQAVDDYIVTCAKAGKKPDKSYSGKMMFRVNPQIHASAALAAELSGQSLNQWAEKALEEAARKSTG